MSRPFTLLAILTALTLPCAAAPSAPEVPSLAGTWRLVPQLSTDPSPWTTLDIVIAIDGPRVTITDRYKAGNRSTDTVTALDLGRSVNIVPVPSWFDKGSIGAYIGGDRTERVRARWLDGGRILRTDADVVLDTQQGSRAVNVLTDYKISPGGNELAVVELRSSREIPIVYVLKRINP